MEGGGCVRSQWGKLINMTLANWLMVASAVVSCVDIMYPWIYCDENQMLPLHFVFCFVFFVFVFVFLPYTHMQVAEHVDNDNIAGSRYQALAISIIRKPV